MKLVQGNTVDTWVLIKIVLWILRTMAGRGNGRDDAEIDEALGMLVVVLEGKPNGAGIGADRQLGNFQRNNPPLFKGTHDPIGAQKWLKDIERIF